MHQDLLVTDRLGMSVPGVGNEPVLGISVNETRGDGL